MRHFSVWRWEFWPQKTVFRNRFSYFSEAHGPAHTSRMDCFSVLGNDTCNFEGILHTDICFLIFTSNMLQIVVLLCFVLARVFGTVCPSFIKSMNEHIKDSTTELGATIRSAHESKAQTSWIPLTLVLEGRCIGQNGPTDHTRSNSTIWHYFCHQAPSQWPRAALEFVTEKWEHCPT